jgi:hypothetical protein
VASKEVSVEIYVEKLANLVHNEANPRYIKSKKHRELMDSLKEFPEMKLLREIVVDENNLILAGDKRVYALEELGYADATIKKVFNLSEAKKREFIAKDNIHNGEWDTDVIANQWDADQLKEWGVPDFKVKGLGDDKPKDDYKNHDVTCPNCGEHFSLSDSAE